MGRAHVTAGLALAAGVSLVAVGPAVGAGPAAHHPGRGHGTDGPVVVDERRATATGWGGAVASLDPYASEAGLQVLRRGGNAVDAAVATAATLGVTRPYDGSIGGGGFWVIYDAGTREVTTIDARETAPAAMEPDVWLDDAGEPIPFAERRVSGLSPGVPGVVAGWELALELFGSKPLHRLLGPAIRVADRGFVVDAEYERRTEANLEIFRTFASTAETFLVDGEAPQEGDVFRNPELADTYRLLARRGADAFYTGDLAETIAETVQVPPLSGETDLVVRPGIMEPSDVAAYEALEREPTAVEYTGATVWGMGPPSSGGTTVGEALNILERLDLASMSEAEVDHHVIEAAALAFADRNAYVGDPAYVEVPIGGLLSQGFADERSGLVGELAAAKPVAPGDPWPYDDGDGEAEPAVSTTTEGSTTHLTVADRWGNVVSHTFTIEQIGGSGIAVPGYGFILNNQLTDFETAVGVPNSPDGGKRPRSSMAPTIVTDDRGAPVAAFGSPGGATIINTVLQIAVDHLQRDRSLPDAVAAPRLSNTNSHTTQAEPGIPAAELAARGHELVEPPGGIIGNATGVAFLEGGLLQAVAEPVRAGGGSALVLTQVRRR